MRLNLGEIAQCMGCGPNGVLWDGLSSNGGLGRANAAAPTSLKDLAAARSGSGKPMETPLGSASNWSFAPWSQITPTGARIDSRQVKPGDLFFCLPGENVDGHTFAATAMAAGASAVIASRNPFDDAPPVELMHTPVFLVEDVTKALWQIATCHRNTSPARIIGLTGTAGKTSVKEVLSQVLEIRGRTERNPLNLNNQIGLPLSMLNASADASFWVMEMGISHAHDMDELGSILKPDIGIILNVGDGHVAGLGDMGVAAYKARLLDYIQPGGMAIVSADYPDLTEQVNTRRMALAQKGIQLLHFSARNTDVYCSARYTGPSGLGGGMYEVTWADGMRMELATPFRSDYGSENMAAIMAVAQKLLLTVSEIKMGLANAKLPQQRFRAEQYVDHTLLDDSYNANPLSSGRMIQAARDMADESGLPLVLVMGEMLELGDVSDSAHENLGMQMAASCPEAVFWKGGQHEAVKRGLHKQGYKGLFNQVEGPEDFTRLLDEIPLPRALVLFKGSRSNHLEQLVDVFKAKIGERKVNAL
ncbi:UDP-N-acetylmuramoyl-tripeptide--D-alanyl-D-alanine ligase [Desulfovibrio sp. OttesenSCG-928-G15]|nr:UDP-N-acetylmuramoyl-tripeptide--D-alanyl-D-alanine ligase [Desulfovibrio sp. OttesenSCG-928-G15]